MHEGEVDPHGGRVLMATALETLSEQRCFGGVQGFYATTSTATGGPMRFARLRPPRRGAAPRAGALLPRRADLHRGDVHDKGRRAARRRRRWGWCSSPATPARARRASRATTRDWDFGLGAGFYVDATAAPWRADYRMDTLRHQRAARRGRGAASRCARDARGIFGHSMGGHGALTLALRNPDRYRSVSAFAPIVAPSRGPLGPEGVRRLPRAGTRRPGPPTTPARWCARGRVPTHAAGRPGDRATSSSTCSCAGAVRGGVRRRRASRSTCAATPATTTATTSSPASSTSTSRTTRALSRPECPSPSSQDAQRPGGFRRRGRDRVHERRRQAVVGLELQLLEASADRRHLFGRRPASMIDDTKAANPGGAQPDSRDSSG